MGYHHGLANYADYKIQQTQAQAAKFAHLA